MAKQTGIFQIEGTIENVTFYKSADGYKVRKKGGVTRERIMNDPAYARTRENLSQFGLSAKAGKLIRAAIPSLLKKAKDSRVSSRLTKIMSEIAKNDHESPRGKKKVLIGIDTTQGINLLKGFNFNKRAIFETIFSCPYEVNAATGEIKIANIIIEEQIDAPKGATHVGFRSALTAINFKSSEYDTSYSKKQVFPINLDPQDITLEPSQIPSAGQDAKMMVMMLVEFYQEVDDVQYPLSNGAYNTLAILEIE